MKYDLVFEGGGAKGMVFVGACDEFFKRGHTFGRLLGTSAGAITGTLLAVGYTPEEMLHALTEKENDRSVFAGFMGTPPPFTDEEIFGGATRRLLSGVDFRFLTASWENKLYDRLAKAGGESELSPHTCADRTRWLVQCRSLCFMA